MNERLHQGDEHPGQREYALSRRGADATNVVFCAADVGCGHSRAATAMMLAMRQRRPDLRPQLIDALGCAPAWFNHLYRDGYLAAVRHLPRFNGWLYRVTDTDGIPPHRGFGSGLEALAMKAFCGSDAVRNADLIVCTHFLCARVLSRMREKEGLRGKLVVVVTDQHPHAVWRVRNADLYLVPSTSAEATLVEHGIDPDQVRTTGIPIDSRFDHPLSKLDARRWHDLPADRPILLITGGGLGLGGIDAALDGALGVKGDHFAVVVCGHNDKLREQLTARVAREKLQDRCRIVGLTTKMHELMAAADLMVGKPGGLTTSEAFARSLPMVLLRPIPGQEECNADVIVKSGAAVRKDDPFEAGTAGAQLLAKPAQLRSMSLSSANLGNSGAARAAAEAVLDLLDPTPAIEPKAASITLRSIKRHEVATL